MIVTTERDSLELHVDLCSLRYQQLEGRLQAVEHRLDALNAEVDDLKATVSLRFDEIKTLISENHHEKFRVMVATTGTIIVALIGMLGYVITHIQ